ncbi:cyclin-like protein [Gautieria morchelliformis]|nr:cyclin-like protein [Gautieria morchelliformis]
MATDFWASSHYRRWIVDRSTLRQARSDDRDYATDEELAFLGIFFANLISKLGKKLDLRQRVIATATVFFRRFYLKNSYCDTDPFLLVAACCYVAAKAEETPVHVKNVVAEARALFSSDEYDIKGFPSDNTRLAEMEFYLVDDLECDLTVFHPYRTLMTLCRKEGSAETEAEDISSQEAEAGEVGVGIDDPRYWGTGQGKLELQEPALQMAWFIINDTYRSDLCLIYPPHLIAIAAIYLTCILHPSTRNSIHAQSASRAVASSSSTSAPRRSSRQATQSSNAAPPKGKGKERQIDTVGWLAGLNVSMPLIATIAQEIISLYCLWDRFSDDHGSESARGTVGATRKGKVVSLAMEVVYDEEEDGKPKKVTTSLSLTKVWKRMRQSREADFSHPASGQPLPVNKSLILQS